MPRSVHQRHGPPPEAPPELADPVHGVTRWFSRFARAPRVGAALLVLATAVAMLWANLPSSSESYHHFFETEIVVGLSGARVFRPSLHFLINDLLMVLFFFVAGLEIKVQLTSGALSSRRRAALPLAMAFGGMVVPALIFVAIAAGDPARLNGWGIPVATDIAFALGIYAFLDKRLPSSLRALLLALAIADDIGAILVIALFYSTSLNAWGLGLAGIGVVLALASSRAGVRSMAAYAFAGAVVWGGVLVAGVHPTVAGVVVGLMIPARPWLTRDQAISTVVETAGDPHEIEATEQAARAAVSPARRLDHKFEPWVICVIMPLFALANAGVELRGLDELETTQWLTTGAVAGGLVLGKPIGIVGAAWAAIRARIAELPEDVGMRAVLVVACLAGIGFTMSLFIATLAYQDANLLSAAKLGVLAGSTVAVLLAFVVRPS